MNSNKISARIFGVSFLIGYLSYGIGFGLLNSFIDAPASIEALFDSKNMVIFLAAILMAVLASVNIILGIVMTPIFKPYNQMLAYGYLSAAIASTLLLIVGAIFLLLIVPLSEAFLQDGTNHRETFELLFVLIKKANFFSYQLAMVIWGFGGLVFTYLLYVSKIVPRWMSVWGFIAYVIFVSGAFFALFGISIDLILDIPGGLFELFLSFWLLFKGFDFRGQKKVA